LQNYASDLVEFRVKLFISDAQMPGDIMVWA